MSDQVNQTLDEQNPSTDVENNPAEKDKAIAIDSAKPKSPAAVVEPAPISDKEKERKQA